MELGGSEMGDGVWTGWEWDGDDLPFPLSSPSLFLLLDPFPALLEWFSFQLSEALSTGGVTHLGRDSTISFSRAKSLV